MATITEIRQGLAAAILASPASAVLSQVTRSPVSSPTTPCAWVIREGTDFDFTLQGAGDGDDQLTFVVQVFVAMTSSVDSQDLLDGFAAKVGPLSIKAALEVIDQPPHITLGGLVDDLRVSSVSRDQVVTLPGVGAGKLFLGLDFTVDVYAPGLG